MSSLAHQSGSSYLHEVAQPHILTHKHKSGETSFISDKTSTVWSPAAKGLRNSYQQPQTFSRSSGKNIKASFQSSHGQLTSQMEYFWPFCRKKKKKVKQ